MPASSTPATLSTPLAHSARSHSAAADAQPLALGPVFKASAGNGLQDRLGARALVGPSARPPSLHPGMTFDHVAEPDLGECRAVSRLAI